MEDNNEDDRRILSMGKKIHKFHPLLNNITQRDKGKASNTTRFKPLLGFLNSNARSAILQNKQPKNGRPFIQQYL